MPKRTDLKSIAIIGAGPIVIGQACEFDYSGTQACKALRAEGYKVVLVNSNPATIMTDPDMADRTYIEPVTPDYLAAVLRKERPDALIPTMGGQTGLNTAFQVADAGVLTELGIELLGADRDVIHRAEDRDAFRTVCRAAGLDLPKSELAHTMDEARAALDSVGLPCIIRPAFTLGGTGGGVAYNREEYFRIVETGLDASLVHEVLVEESVLGWKELEVELLSDPDGNTVVVCTIENVDPMGVHTGDSVTVAPAQTLTDRDTQRLREASIAMLKAVGVRGAGCNVQFAQCPKTGRLVAIELNPRVSRSSALASKATGVPIAKLAAKMAVGYRLDELRNDIVPSGTACREPGVDYCVVKIPRFAFEKFPGSDERLGVQMKSVGEVMAIGRTFGEAVQKGLRSMENGRMGFGADGRDREVAPPRDEIESKLRVANRDRLLYLRDAILAGFTAEEVFALSGIDPWWYAQLEDLVAAEKRRAGRKLADLPDAELTAAKRMGFSDTQLAFLLDVPGKKTDLAAAAAKVRAHRHKRGVFASYRLVDTCDGLLAAERPYFYSTYGEADESRADTGREKILILGGGPNRIGQGIEFDYCCCHAAFAAREAGYEAVIVNCNPETVSTDFDTSDRLYFEPLTVEDVLEIVHKEKPKGVIVQFGGQTPLNISRALVDAGVPILGTSVDSIDRASDRGQFAELLKKLKLRQPPNATATELPGALAAAEKLGYPVLMRPSFVLGGAKMEIVYDEASLRQYWEELLVYCTKADVEINARRPILVDKFLAHATEVDVDVVSDGRDVHIAGVMEHVEEAGIHSGDSACSLPPFSLAPPVVFELEDAAKKLARELDVHGLMNVQFAIRRNEETETHEIYVLEVNPRASRTVPFVSKVTGYPEAKWATRIMLGDTVKGLGLPPSSEVSHRFGVKEAVFPFAKLLGGDSTGDAALGPEMKSTGEVMGLDRTFAMAYAKSQIGAGETIPTEGTVFLSVKSDLHKRLRPIAKGLFDMGFTLVGTSGTAEYLNRAGIPADTILKVSEGRPNVLDLMTDGKVKAVFNTPSGKRPKQDEIRIRTTAVGRKVMLCTTLDAMRSFVAAAKKLKEEKAPQVRALQDYHRNADSLRVV